MIGGQTFGAAGESEGHKYSDDSKYFDTEQSVHFASVRIGAEKLKDITSRDTNLLLFRARKITVNCNIHRRRFLQRQVIQKHVFKPTFTQCLTRFLILFALFRF